MCLVLQYPRKCLPFPTEALAHLEFKKKCFDVRENSFISRSTKIFDGNYKKKISFFVVVHFEGEKKKIHTSI